MSLSAVEISQLAKLLHQNGDKVLNALSKLSLNAVLLQKLNKEFDVLIENGIDCEAPFQVISSHNGNSELVKDLHFLHDFIQKTLGLKLTKTSSLSLLDNKVDISKFKSVKYLEIKKIPIKEVIGLKNVQSQLESIVCIRCLSMLEELLANCGGDNSSGFVWSELREAVLSFNSIRVVDTSIAFAPWLQVLDLSHNLITDVKAIECLPNLKYVNLSFNCLDAIPTFNKSARKKIELLVLKNNYIEDLSGLNGLCHLTELDVSNNLVSGTEGLDPLLSLSTLQWLSLAGNPISFHKNYRRSVSGYLHISASFSDFYLDKIKLSKKEKAVVGIKLCNGDATLNRNQIGKISKSFNAKSVEENRNKQQGSSLRKSGKVRLIVIPNLDDGTYEEEPSDLNSSYFRATSTEHLITKKRIENTRSAYGVDNWLVQGSSVVQDILGLPSVEITNSTPFDDMCLQAALDSVKNVVTTTAVIETQPEPQLGSSVKTNKDSFITCNETESGSQYFSAETSGEKEETSTTEEPESVIEQPEPVKETSPDIEEIKEEEVEIDENEKLYVVSKEVKTFNQETKQEEMFLTITDTELQEREITRGKIITKWSLSVIESCVKLKPNQLQLVFGTVRRDKKERTYNLDEEEAGALYKQIAEILERRTLSDMNQVVYKCENCSSQFSVEIKSRKSESNNLCPFCNSKFILQLDEVPLPSYSEDKKKNGVVGEKDVKISHNRSSSAGGFFQSLLGQNDEKMLKCASQSSIGSAASLDEINELPTIHNTNVKRSDSDIEILSNPSQSSIEVIDGTGRLSGSTPLRKKSSEERQFVAPESVVAAINLIQGNNPTGLTESSSSGSITDSICTAYEGSSGAPPNGNKTDSSKTLTKESEESEKQQIDPFNENSDSLLQGVLQRARTEIKKKEVDLVNYSFVDFTNIDHRVKYFLYTHVYDDLSEEFIFGVRGVVLSSNNGNPFPSFVTASSRKFYFLEVTSAEQGDDARNFLRKNNSLIFDLKTVSCIFTLTWHQGFGVKIHLANKPKEYLVLLKEPSRTQNFFNYLTSSELPFLDKIQIIKETLERPYLAMQHLLLSCTSLEDSSVRYFCLFNFCSVINSKETKDIKSGGLLTNSKELILFGENLNWLFDNGEKPPSPAFCQKFTNLVHIYIARCRIILEFDGIEEEIWSVTMESEKTAETLLEAMKYSKEKDSTLPLKISSF